MSAELPPHIWFVRSNRGSGSYPVGREGWIVVLKFVAGMFGWGLAAVALAAIGVTAGPMWMIWTAPFVFAIGAALSAWYFIDTARRHTDYSVTFNDFARKRSGAQGTT